ncbi:MAG TPA: hypothetical protein VGO11_10470 [Chthoniobacteraceae bacterium]|jgi:hypothetical protein|nr:hypothetical protein [Chthoniobacteraceae bacterium]
MRSLPALFLFYGLAAAFGEAPEKPAVAEKPLPARYMHFPETVSPDGEYILAWGNSLSPGVPLHTLAEAPYATWIDPGRFEIQDYLVETKRTHAPLVLPGFEYFSGSKGHEDLHGITIAWSPDSKGVLAIYDSDAGYISAVWAEPEERRVSDLGKTFEAKLRGLVIARFGEAEAAASRHVFFSRVAVLEPNLLTIDGTLSRSNLMPEKPFKYWFRMRFTLQAEKESTHAELLTSREVHPDEVAAEQKETADPLEQRLAKAFDIYRAQLPFAGRDAVKKEQALWLKQREALANEWNRTGFTRHRIDQLKIRAAEYEPAKP